MLFVCFIIEGADGCSSSADDEFGTLCDQLCAKAGTDFSWNIERGDDDCRDVAALCASHCRKSVRMNRSACATLYRTALQCLVTAVRVCEPPEKVSSNLCEVEVDYAALCATDPALVPAPADASRDY